MERYGTPPGHIRTWRHSVTINKWLAGGAMLAIAAISAAGIAAPASTVLAASNGEVIIGSTATNGDIRVGGLTANDLGPDNQQAKNVSNAVSNADTGPNQGPPPTVRD